MNYYLAIDIGASSGRHILFWLEKDKIQAQEVYRFANGMEEKNGHLCWDYETLLGHVVQGMARCRELNKIPVSVGIDTWGVDFVLLDSQDRIIGDSVGYRDVRTEGMDEILSRHISPEALYGRTGIQKAIYNTIYQLMAVKTQNPQQLQQADAFLMVPDYLHFRLCGVKANEYTNATTTQLINPANRSWDWELMDTLGYPRHIFQKILPPGTVLGHLTPAVQKQVGYDCQVVLTATHDTASAILALPTNASDTIFLSSGTWSLLGIELPEADCSPSSRQNNFSNEGGYHGICYLKNIMGLWMIQSLKKELQQQGTDLSFAQLCQLAARETIPSVVPCNHQRFLAPHSMVEEIRLCCRQTNQPVPQPPGELACVVYNSLAVCYQEAVAQLSSHFGKTFSCISIIGGGSNAAYLNQLTADRTGCTVWAGPSEATAIGNALSQMLCLGELPHVTQARETVARSFPISAYFPQKSTQAEA